jgi:4-hydroxybenzoate polyprenyltransferase
MWRKAISSLTIELSHEKAHALARLGRYQNQIGTKLLFWPCAWGVALGAPFPFSVATAATIGLFYFGAFNLRSAGCAVNDLLDKDFDKQVDRTKNRPIANGDVTPLEAKKFIAAHLTGGLVTLAFMKKVAIQQSLLIFPLAMSYPLAKRYTNYAQVVLGMCFNSGVFIGFAQASGLGLVAPILPFYLAGIAWTVIYDTIYALQDVKDDKALKLKGLALHWGRRTKRNCKRANLLMLISFLYGGYLFDLNSIYHLGMLANYFVLNGWLNNVKFSDKTSFHNFFMANAKIGLAIFLLIMLGRIRFGHKEEASPKKD